MADVNSKLEIGVTTGPIRGSRKIHIESPRFPDVRVGMREIALEPSAGEPPVRVFALLNARRAELQLPPFRFVPQRGVLDPLPAPPVGGIFERSAP